MSMIDENIVVEVPTKTAYNQWTQFEDFPRFMEGVESVKQLDDKRLHWVAEIAGKKREWDAEIVEQTPDRRIAWKSTAGELHSGVVSFESIDDSKTRVSLQMEYDPKDFAEKTADVLGFVRRRVEGDLERYKKFIENRGQETGAWRGEIDQNRKAV